MKFKKKQEVKVKENLEVGKNYGMCIFTETMKDFRGKIFTISKVGYSHYLLENCKYKYSEEMLECVEQNMYQDKDAYFSFDVDDEINEEQVQAVAKAIVEEAEEENKTVGEVVNEIAEESNSEDQVTIDDVISETNIEIPNIEEENPIEEEIKPNQDKPKKNTRKK